MYARGLFAERAGGHSGASCVGRNWKFLAMAGAIAFALCASAPAADPTIVRIEEDWEVIIATPDANSHAPQLINAMSSTNKLADVHGLFEINHKTQPDYVPGYIQLQCWSGDTLLGYGTSSKTGLLKTDGEVIKYTFAMYLSNGNVVFDVINGTSTTWGDFGRQKYMKVAIPTTQLYFPLYSPEVSVANSRVSYAAHRVKKFAQKEVRYYDALGILNSKDTTERVVHQLSN